MTGLQFVGISKL